MKELLTSGTTSPAKPPAILPPPQHLALIATLAVHPTLTIRAKTPDRLHAANLALQYLQLVLHHVGPRNEIIGEAFSFSRQSPISRRGVGSRRRAAGEGVSPTSNKSDGIENELANAGSVWASAEDFWHVIGWSFNCSVSCKRRWERWSAWLALIVEILEGDWEAGCGEQQQCTKASSLIVKYINSGRGTAGKERRIVRAVFANGWAKSVKEFGEVWLNETKELRQDDEVRKAEARIDIEADDYGDYMEDENEAELEHSASEKSLPPEDGTSSDITTSLGGMSSINLRIRLLALLSRVSHDLPEAFVDINTLYHVFYEHIRPLPMPAFFAIISPSGLRLFDLTAASTLTQYVLRSIIATAAPLPPNDDISQDILESNYLPYPANSNSLVDNTKVSICVETLLRLLNKHIGLQWTPNLQKATEDGIKARATKAKGKQTKKGMTGNESCDATWLSSSAERIKTIVGLARP